MKRFTFLFILFSFNLTTNIFADCKFEQDLSGDEIMIGVMLNWATAVETDNLLFVVERSTDGITFKNLGAVKAAGNSAEIKKYSFLDHDPLEEKVYYRLRQVDQNGTYRFSKILSFQKNNPNQFMVNHYSSVEATDRFEITINSKVSDLLTYTLKDWKGNTLNVESTPTDIGDNNIVVNLDGLEYATYRIEMEIGTEIETLTFKKVESTKVSKQNIAILKQAPLMEPR